MSIDIQHRTCKVCSKSATRVNMGTYTKKSSKRWIGDDGRQWNGLVCPDCHAEAALTNMRRLRAERKGSNDPSEA